ncbi:hypothetical protein FALBO_4155 [Fusarium albosuccineum]|uniref:Uncharacterized protein n=1 Tax=Fusarium albosuccineum TaxID=1237068 RepID=A0A8H4LIU7_9HYPO|nr:hypothetical protein FALBO_4155 [Fusarium albosuccineum]
MPQELDRGRRPSDGGIRLEEDVRPEMESAWERGLESLGKHIKEDVPQMTDKEYQRQGMPGHPDPLFSEHWTEQDEAKLQEDLKDSVLGWALTVKAQTKMACLWKVSLRLFGYDPLTLFTLRGNDLEPGVTGTITIQGRDYPSPLWSQNFCKKLARIMTHPLWKGRKPWQFMLFVIKWAVICRTGDRRPLAQADIEVLELARCQIVQGPPDASLPDGIKQHRRIVPAIRRWPTDESNLLNAIADRYASGDDSDSSSPDFYTVTTTDLATIIESLDRGDGRSVVISCEVHFQAMLCILESYTWPSREEVMPLYRSCWLNIERRRGRARTSTEIATAARTKIHTLASRVEPEAEEGEEGRPTIA